MHSNFIAIIIAAATAMPATAQQGRNCAPRSAVVERLQGTYGEVRQSMGLDNGLMVETWANRFTGTFTVTATAATGITCLISSGDSFERISEALPPKGTEGSKLR